VTDADLVLGYLDPAFFLGGQMRLDRDAARRAIAERVAKPLGLDPVEAAWGVHQLANESMAGAARIHAIERGKDVERFPIFAFGGAGPVHAFGVARILRSPSVIYPLGAGVMSAVGFLVAPLSFDFVRTLPGPLDALDWKAVAGAVAEMESEGLAILGRTIPAERVRFRRFADMRYRKQGYEIRVPVPDGPLEASRRDEIRLAFETAYRAVYGHTVRDAPIEVVSWRVVAQGPRPELRLPTCAGASRDPRAALKGERHVYLPDARGYGDVPVYDRYALGAGATLDGPVIIEERESTVVVTARARIRVDQHSNVLVEMPPAA
jgi:N-methylhydantoinase A